MHFSLGNLLLNASVGKATLPSKILIATTKELIYEGEVFSFSKKDLETLKANFDKNELGREIPIIYDHAMSGLITNSRAAGWIGGLELTEANGISQLFATEIRWTEGGKRDVLDESYKYTSTGILNDGISAKDNKTKVGKLIYELSLTNNPADHNLNAIQQLSNHFKEGANMSQEDKNQNSNQDKILELNAVLTEKILELENTQKTLTELKNKVNENKEKYLLEKKKNIELERNSKLDKMILQKKITPKEKEVALTLDAQGFVGFEALAESRKVDAYNDNPKSKESNNNVDELTEDQMELKVIELATKYETEKKMEAKEAMKLANKEVFANKK